MGAPAAFQSFCSEMVYITSTPIHLVQECHVAKPKVNEVVTAGTLSQGQGQGLGSPGEMLDLQ